MGNKQSKQLIPKTPEEVEYDIVHEFVKIHPLCKIIMDYAEYDWVTYQQQLDIKIQLWFEIKERDKIRLGNNVFCHRTATWQYFEEGYLDSFPDIDGYFWMPKGRVHSAYNYRNLSIMN